jgi:hypothetical protein
LSKILQEAGGPEMGMMLSMMGTDNFMSYITKSYQIYTVEKERIRRAKEEQK